MCKRTFPVLFAFLMVFSLSLPAQNRNKQDAPMVDEEQFEGLEWRNIGPFRGGRSVAVAGIPGNETTYYAGYTGGGVWKTENAGRSWHNISDGFLKTGSVGEIAISEAEPNVIYVGMGEHAVRGVMTTFGDGIYKSTDGGKTWEHKGLPQSRHISDIAIHPANSEVVWVAVQGALHGPSSDRGIYKSTDGGDTWKKTLYVDENTGASSLSLDMNNPRILYAATWEHRRYPWTVESGGPGCAIWKSTDGGETWEKLSKGLPKEMGKIGVSVSRADNNRIFAIVESNKKEAGVYRSDDAGANWTHLTNDQNITSRSWYYMEVFADPVDKDIVYVLNAPATRSTDGGRTFKRMPVGHGDTHDLWINPKNNKNLILGDDGGAEISFDSGQNWSTLYNQPTAQFYRVNVDHQFPYKVYGGQQDNSSVVIASRTNGRGITEQDWFRGPGCESAYIAFDPENPVVLFGGCYQGLISRLDTRTNESKDIMQYPSLKLATEPKDMKYRYNWNAPIVASPHDPSVIYHAGNVVFKTTDGGISWEEISPDLTRNEEEKQGPGGSPHTNEGAGGENYNTIYCLMESELEKGVIYTGSDCGLVYLTRDGGGSWENVTPKGVPESNVHALEVSPHQKGKVFICPNRYKFNDMSAMAYRSRDYGKSWMPINAGIEEEDFLRVIREDKEIPGLLYGGGERGFYISYDDGDHWSKLQLNLPVVPVTDLISHDNDLIAATQGRAFWILDDLGPLQQSGGKLMDDKLTLFEPKASVRFQGGSAEASSEYRMGENPASGVILTYFVPDGGDSTEAKLEIMDEDGKVLRTLSSKKDESFKSYPGGPPPPTTIPAAPGLNRFAWDMRTEVLEDIPNAFVYGSYEGRMVGPGAYKARLTYGDQTAETNFTIIPDPRLEVSMDDWEAQQAMMVRIDDQLEEMHRAVNETDKIKKQVMGYNELMKDMPEVDTLIKAGKGLIKEIDNWQKNVVERRQKNTQDVINWPGKLNAEFFTLRRKVDAHDPTITQGVKDRLADLESMWGKYKKEYEEIMQDEVQRYNILFRERNVPALITAEN